MPDFEFWSTDNAFGLRIGEKHMLRILRLCQQPRQTETGGILVGAYTRAHDCAVVTGISGPPPDSKHGRTWFARGVGGLQRCLDRLWRSKQQYYLGEWHFHPGAEPTPSDRDSRQMKEIANTRISRCPQPLLLIVGGSPPEEWTSRAYIFPRGAGALELLQVLPKQAHTDTHWYRLPTDRESAD